ncbi:hypothetical protein C7S18_22100 [Ahniella affigens]|uniref:General secretion pathway protein GspN n=1 Tax=Ahniella affigens TaxID=2021234 RepID=A0A2P1PXZ6_9GAMM|nr:hypothetical protein [Ahniella affigens]AVP99700.1 hypothetical protein C7S18_22100 [Ahniella affigens]
MSPAKRLTTVLGSIAALLVGVFVAQQFGIGAGFDLAEGDGPKKAKDYLSGLSKEGFKLAEFGTYQELIGRPVFNEDRKPTPIEEPKGPEVKPTDIVDLDVTLTSVIHSKDKKVAIVRDNKSNESMVVRVGMPLEGEQSGWKLVEVEPRKVVFESESGNRKDLELAVNGAAIARAEGSPPPAQQPMNNGAPPPPPPPPPAQQVESDAANQAKAEEIRRRIEERRRQLREEAERMRAQESSQ